MFYNTLLLGFPRTCAGTNNVKKPRDDLATILLGVSGGKAGRRVSEFESESE
jgi:hypothetical protein